jgi:hypothetical protein
MAKLQVIASESKSGAYGYNFSICVLRSADGKRHYAERTGFGWGLHGDSNQGGMRTIRYQISDIDACTLVEMLRGEVNPYEHISEPVMVADAFLRDIKHISQRDV